MQAEGQEWVQEWNAWLRTHYASLPPPPPSDNSKPIAPPLTPTSSGAVADAPASAVDEEAGGDDESPLGPFYPGLFVSNLFDRLQNMHSQPFAVNLALTGVLAKLCYCPHPIAHACVGFSILYFSPFIVAHF